MYSCNGYASCELANEDLVAMVGTKAEGIVSVDSINKTITITTKKLTAGDDDNIDIDAPTEPYINKPTQPKFKQGDQAYLDHADPLLARNYMIREARWNDEKNTWQYQVQGGNIKTPSWFDEKLFKQLTDSFSSFFQGDILVDEHGRQHLFLKNNYSADTKLPNNQLQYYTSSNGNQVQVYQGGSAGITFLDWDRTSNRIKVRLGNKARDWWITEETLQSLINHNQTLWKELQNRPSGTSLSARHLFFSLFDPQKYAELSKSYERISFDTGGYTGKWGPEGRLAMLHQKEIVLNAHDTENLLSVVDIVRQLATKLDFNALTMARGLGDLMATAMVNTGNQQLDQNVTITAEFPNATNREEIQAAFGDLVNLAAQYANRK